MTTTTRDLTRAELEALIAGKLLRARRCDDQHDPRGSETARLQMDALIEQWRRAE